MAIKQLRRIVSDHSSILSIVGSPTQTESGDAEVSVRIEVSDIPRLDGGLQLGPDHETIILSIDPYYPASPPSIRVDHDRFVGEPHVLQGDRLCIYLDPSREWNPDAGMTGVMNRLWDWLTDAAAGTFDPRTALFHPVGGVVHHTPGTPLVVVRPTLEGVPQKAIRRVALSQRTPQRVDLISWNRSQEADPTIPGLAITVPASLPYGAGTRFDVLAGQLHQLGIRASSLTAALSRTASSLKANEPIYVVLVVPHRADIGAPAHLIALRLPGDLAGALHDATAVDATTGAIDPRRVPVTSRVEWCSVSDERPEIVTRRDATRPTSQYLNTRVEIWGSGALGSWIAELITRAGAAEVILRDPGRVMGGLLVRQDYEEADVGANKAQQLAGRLGRLADAVSVRAEPETAVATLIDGLPDCDLIIDATINNGVAYWLDRVSSISPSRPWLARVATDVATATLGLLVVAAPGDSALLGDLDKDAGARVDTDSKLERFSTFWDATARDELVPAPGCSLPTFHGSAADVVGVAGSLVTFLGQQMRSQTSGVHLFALPQSGGGGPHHHYIDGAGAVS